MTTLYTLKIDNEYLSTLTKNRYWVPPTLKYFLYYYNLDNSYNMGNQIRVMNVAGLLGCVYRPWDTYEMYSSSQNNHVISVYN